MVGALLDFSRMEAGRAQATFVPTDLAAFTVDLASAFRSAVESAGLTLDVDCPALPEPIYVDPEMWEKVVLNLLSNALKYTHRGGIGVRLGWEEDRAVLSVRDTGVGIPEDELPRIFERFYRARANYGRSYEGTGIGLALVQELVKLHGGSVDVESTLGEGSTFTVQIPRGFAHLPAERLERTPRPRSSAAGAAAFVEEARRWSLDEGVESRFERSAEALPDVPAEPLATHILLADDNADLRAYVAGILRQFFRTVETVPDGRAALQAARARRPDLIVSDVMMPGLDGFGLVGALRGEEQTRTIPIILLSARAGEESTVEGLRSGADDYLVKPFSARELIARVRTQLQMSRMRAESAQARAWVEDLQQTVAMRDEFISVASHELRTPLTALAVHLETLLRIVKKGGLEGGNGRITEKLEAAIRQSERLAGWWRPSSTPLAWRPEGCSWSSRSSTRRRSCARSSIATSMMLERWERPFTSTPARPPCCGTASAWRPC